MSRKRQRPGQRLRADPVTVVKPLSSALEHPLATVQLRSVRNGRILVQEVEQLMPNGHVKVFHADKNYGFLTSLDGHEVYVSGDQVHGEPLRSGDEVEFEIVDGDRGRQAATSVAVTKQAPPNNPVGRTMVPPASWDDLEDRERQRRMARRRRR